MASKLVVAPRLPHAPAEYSSVFMAGFMRILNLYFAQLDSPGPMAASTQRNGTEIVSGLSFVQPGTTPGTFVVSLPTQADLANLRTGDVYYDTSAGNVLKIVP
jgi:hypothetical protein